MEPFQPAHLERSSRGLQRARSVRWPGGFSLLEVVMAAFLFSAVFGSIVTLWVYSDRALSLRKQRDAAGMVAEQTMSRCLAAGFYQVDDLVAAGPKTVTIVQEVDGVSHPARYVASVLVALEPDESLKLITVRVEYEDRGVKKKLELHHVLYWATH